MTTSLKSTIKTGNSSKERRFDIPIMASEVSQKITDYKQNHQLLVEESITFFTSYLQQMEQLGEFKRTLTLYKRQIATIENYKKKHGKLPQIKGQKSAAKFLTSLNIKCDNLVREYKALIKDIGDKRTARQNALDELADDMIDLLGSKKIFSQFLGTISLSTPLPDEKIRCLRNEKYKPIYIAALVVALFDDVRRNHQFENRYLKTKLHTIFGDNNAKYMTAEDEPELDPQIKMDYREEVLKPIAKAALLQSIGSYSPEVEAIFGGDRYRQLDESQRNNLIDLMHQKSLDYLKVGIGLPISPQGSAEDKKAFISYESEKLRFMLAFLDSQFNKSHELDDLLRLPMVYSSFIVSTKPEYDYHVIYQAYDFIEAGIEDKQYNEKFARLFLAMVGKFPVGSGIYFVSKETEAIEKAIVSSLYPAKTDEPLCKQITRQQSQSLSQTEVIVSRDSNIFYEDVRKATGYEEDYFTRRFQNDFTFNANELWEVQIPAMTFWKKIGKPKHN